MGGTNRASYFFLEGVFQVLPWPGSIAFARAPPRALVRALKWNLQLLDRVVLLALWRHSDS